MLCNMSTVYYTAKKAAALNPSALIFIDTNLHVVYSYPDETIALTSITHITDQENKTWVGDVTQVEQHLLGLKGKLVAQVEVQGEVMYCGGSVFPVVPMRNKPVIPYTPILQEHGTTTAVIAIPHPLYHAICWADSGNSQQRAKEVVTIQNGEIRLPNGVTYGYKGLPNDIKLEVPRYVLQVGYRRKQRGATDIMLLLADRLMRKISQGVTIDYRLPPTNGTKWNTENQAQKEHPVTQIEIDGVMLKSILNGTRYARMTICSPEAKLLVECYDSDRRRLGSQKISIKSWLGSPSNVLKHTYATAPILSGLKYLHKVDRIQYIGAYFSATGTMKMVDKNGNWCQIFALNDIDFR